eukprot:gene7333-5167_t
MPPKKGAKKGGKGKKEALPEPGTMPDGNRNFYIGGWSSYATIEDICGISEDLVRRHTREDREVDRLPRTDVLILPATPNFGTDAEEEDKAKDLSTPDEITELLIADRMQIEGISHLTVKRSQTEKKEWVRPPKPDPEGEAAAAEAAAAAGEDGATPTPADGEAAAAAAAVQEPEEPAPPTAEELAQEAYEAEMERLAQVNVPIGATFPARDAVLDGVIRLIGVLPQIVVKPVLPTPPDREDPSAKGKKGKKGKDRRSSSSVEPAGKGKGKKGKGKKAKLTPEELAELERAMAEEDARFLKETEEAIQLAKEQEEELMTYAHPDRWSNVTISNVTFTGPVQVVRAHTKFINCRFTSPYPDRPQLMVHQYCKVECVKCTFDAPMRCGLYALPASQVTVRKCLFTGIPQLSLYLLERPEADGGAGGEKADRDAVQEIDEDDEEPESKKGGDASGSGSEDELPRTAAVAAAVEKVRAVRPRAVGVFTDCSKVSVEKCRFLVLGTGVLFHGKYKVEKLAPRQRTVAKTQALAILASCRIQYAFSSGICVDKTADDVLIVRNVISDCDYYGLDLRQGTRDVSVYNNKFMIGAAVRIREGVRPQFLHNTLHSIPIDDNKRDNPSMEVRFLAYSPGERRGAVSPLGRIEEPDTLTLPADSSTLNGGMCGIDPTSLLGGISTFSLCSCAFITISFLFPFPELWLLVLVFLTIKASINYSCIRIRVDSLDLHILAPSTQTAHVLEPPVEDDSENQKGNEPISGESLRIRRDWHSTVSTFIAGAVAGSASRTLTAPLDRVKIIVQEGYLTQLPHGHSMASTKNARLSEVARMIYADGGWRGFWRGNLVNCVKASPEFAIVFGLRRYFFSIYEDIVEREQKKLEKMKLQHPGYVPLSRDTTWITKVPRLAVNCAIGAAAGLGSQSILYPLEVVKTRVCVSRNDEFAGGVRVIIRDAYREGGIREFYKGFAPNMVGIVFYRGLEMGIYSSIQQSVMLYRMQWKNKNRHDAALSIAEVGVAGMVASTVAQTATYPLNVVRTRLQTQGANGRAKRYNGMIDCFIKVVRQKGVSALFSGLSANYLKAVPASACAFIVFEKVQSALVGDD